jgi:serine/threonine-protein kinase
MTPRTIGRYQIKHEIDHGGMSVVYLARDPRFDRDVAIKILPHTLQSQKNIRERFDREAKIIASLDHPAIVQVFDYGEDDGQPFLVMRFMPGGSLSDLLEFGRLNLSDTARIAERIGSALDTAHKRGIIHRDLKPGNILFDANGDAFLTDFGIVKMFENEKDIKLTGSVVLGTPAYMSPEQALGKKLDHRADVYALGAVIYEMLTGVPPYKGPTSVTVAMKHVLDPVPHVKELRPELSEPLDAIVAKAMSKEPNERHNSAGELASAFSNVVRTLPRDEQNAGAPIVASRRPVTSNASKSNAETTDKRESPSNNESDQPNRRLLITLGVLAGVMALAGIAMVVIGSIIGNSGAPTQQASSPVVLPPSMTNPPAAQITFTPLPVIGATATLPNTNASQPTLTPPPEATKPPRLFAQIGGSNLRSGPGTNYSLIASMSANEEMLPLEYIRVGNRRWFKVQLVRTGLQGWVFEDVVLQQNQALIDALPLASFVPPSPVPTSTNTPLPTPTSTLPPSPTPTTTPTPGITKTPTPIPLFTPTSALTQTATATSTILTATPNPTVTQTTAPAP